MLVTVFLIGLIAGWTVLSLHSTSPLEQEHKKLYMLLHLLIEKSISQHRSFGISFEKNGYHFWQRQNQKWILVEQDHTFYSRTLPLQGHWQLQLDGQKIALENFKEQPHLIFWNSGDFSTFQLWFSNQENYPFLIEGRSNGELCLKICTDSP
jgi:hypothetical protein